MVLFCILLLHLFLPPSESMCSSDEMVQRPLRPIPLPPSGESGAVMHATFQSGRYRVMNTELDP